MLKSLVKSAIALAALFWFSTASLAATLYISEYSSVGSIGTSTTPWSPGPVLANQTVAVGGGSLQSSAFTAQTKLVLLMCDTGCSISFGTNPTATTVTTLLQQGVPYYFVTSPSQKVAVIANSAGNTGGGSGGSTAISSPLDAFGHVQTSLYDSAGVALTYNANGQATMANSSPVVIASDQTAVPNNITQTGGNALVADDAPAGTTVPIPAGAIYTNAPPTYTVGDRATLQVGSRGSLKIQIMGNDSASSGPGAAAPSDTTSSASVGLFTTTFNENWDGTQWVRQRANTVANGGAVIAELGPYVIGRVTADGQIKASAGFIHTVSIAGLTATPTAGLMTIYCNTAESGTVAYAEWVTATVVGHTITLDLPCSTGIYVGYDATLANAQVTVAYR